MSEQVPLLNLQQIEELNNMVRSIQVDNTKTLETILSETVQIEHTTILTLYNLVVQQWKKKQTVIDNLCHFTLTMMSTVEVLWHQRYDQDDKLSNAEVVIQHLNKNIYELGDENEEFKQKIKEAEIKISSVTQEKERIEQFYRSQSCIGFNQEVQTCDLKTLNKHCSACSEVHIKEEEINLQYLHKSQKLVEEKLQELHQALDQKKQLEEEYHLLKQEHDLTRMELELAELAIKDALAYKNSYLSLMSNIENSQSKIKLNEVNEVNEINEVYEDNNIVNDAQGMIQNVGPYKTHILAAEIPIADALELESICKQYQEPHNNQFSNSCDYSLIKLEAKEEKRTTHQSPFKKKEDKYSKFSKDLSNEISIQQLAQDSKIKAKGSIFGSHDQHEDSSNILNVSSHITKKPQHQQTDRLNKDMKESTSIMMRKSTKKQIDMKKSRKQKQKEVNSSQSSLGKLYTLIANKLVTNRIKTK